MDQKPDKKIAIVLFFVLLGISFLKDHFTPDYYNSPSASFLNPAYHVPRLQSIASQSLFWFVALLYSMVFICLPYLIIRYYFGNEGLTRFVLVTLSLMCLGIYGMILLNHPVLDRGIVPKINRYFHSPIMTMFFIASFTILRAGRKTGGD